MLRRKIKTEQGVMGKSLVQKERSWKIFLIKGCERTECGGARGTQVPRGKVAASFVKSSGVLPCPQHRTDVRTGRAVSVI